jgi:small conductance mechanosensitive channel
MWDTISTWLLEHGITILVIVVAFYIAYRVAGALINRFISRYVRLRGKGRHSKLWFKNRSQTLSAILTSVAGVILLFIALFMVLSELPVNIAPLLASAGVLGIAIGFGAQSLIKDLLSGLFVLLEDQYNKGDVVKVAGIAGLVVEVNLRRTILRDLDGIVHSIPNGQITTASNYTRDWARVNLDISVGYGEDLERVTGVINRVGKELAEDEYFGPLIKKPPQTLRVNKFGDSGIDIKILGETYPMKQWEVTGELRKRLKKAFDEEGIEIPWPHVKLFFGNQQPG